MRKHPVISAMILAFLALAVIAAAEAVTVTYIPRSSAAGPVFAVVDFPREGGRAQPARVAIDTGGTVRKFIAVPYGRCDEISPSGFVLKIKRFGPGPIRITTEGTLIRGPYQGEPPLELLHTCYRVQK